MSNRKYPGFDFPESSIQNMTYNREMIIEDSIESIDEQDPNPLQTPNLGPFDMNFSDIRTVKEKMFEAEDQKNRFQQLYENAVIEFEHFKGLIRHKDGEILKLKALQEKETSRHEEELKNAYVEMATLEKAKRDLEQALEEHKIKLEEVEEERGNMESRM
jgi:DNA mismatch repair ATPase MutS